MKSYVRFLTISLALLLSITVSAQESRSAITPENAAQVVQIFNWEVPHVSINDVIFSPDGTLIASADDSGRLFLWNAHTGEEVSLLRGEFSLSSVAYSPNGTLLAAGGYDGFNGAVWIWSLNQSNEPRKITLDTSRAVNTLVFNPDGQTLTLATNELIILNITDFTSEKFDQKADSVLVYNADGSRLAAASWFDSSVQIIETFSMDTSKTLEGHKGGIYSLAYNPDGLVLASGGEDGSIRLWNEYGENIQTLEGHSGEVFGLAYSPDGHVIASTGADNTLRLWDAETGEELVMLEGPTYIRSIAFSPDGTQIVTGNQGRGAIQIWGVPLLDEMVSSKESTIIDCRLECSASSDSLDVAISCEDGPITTSTNNNTSVSTKEAVTTVTITINEKRTYERSGNTYEITGKIIFRQSNNIVSLIEYDLAVSGGVFGTPQTCQR